MTLEQAARELIEAWYRPEEPLGEWIDALRAALAAPVGEGQRPGEDLKEFGYLPGHYESHCLVCHLRFFGAKRSVVCHPCALDEAAQRSKNAAAPHLAEAAGEQSAAHQIMCPHNRWQDQCMTCEREAAAPTESCAPAAGQSAGACHRCGHPLLDHDRQYGCSEDGCACEGRPAAHPVGLQAEPVAYRAGIIAAVEWLESEAACGCPDPEDERLTRENAQRLREWAGYAAQERPAERAQVPRDVLDEAATMLEQEAASIFASHSVDGAWALQEEGAHEAREEWRRRMDAAHALRRRATGATP